MLIIIACATLINVVFLALLYGKFRSMELGAQQQQKDLLEVSADVLNIRANNNPANLDVLGREWYSASWPGQISGREQNVVFGPYTGDGVPRSPIPAPFEGQDKYSTHLLFQKYETCDAFHRITLLQQLFEKLGRIPVKIAECAAEDSSESVRMWIAAHTSNWNSFAEEDYRAVFEKLKSDPSIFVRAALLSNPKFPDLPWGAALHSDWKDRLQRYSEQELLALMYNPELPVDFLVCLMREKSQDLGIDRQLHSEMISLGLRNPRIIEESRLYGRRPQVTRFGEDVISEVENYSEIWSLAFDRYWDSEISRLTALYIQTTRKTKLAIYNRLQNTDDHNYDSWRHFILMSCSMVEDNELLRLGTQDSNPLCRETALKNINAWHKGRFQYDPHVH